MGLSRAWIVEHVGSAVTSRARKVVLCIRTNLLASIFESCRIRETYLAPPTHGWFKQLIGGQFFHLYLEIITLGIDMSFNGRGWTSLSLQGFKFLPSCSSVARCSDYKNSLCFFWCWQIYKNHQESATKFGQKCQRLPTGLNYKWLPGITKQEGRFNQNQQAYAI